MSAAATTFTSRSFVDFDKRLRFVLEAYFELISLEKNSNFPRVYHAFSVFLFLFQFFASWNEEKNPLTVGR